MKKRSILLLIIIIVLIFIYIVNPFEVEIPSFNGSKTSDITDIVSLGDDKVEVTYLSGNLIDEKVSFNNTYEKIIKIKNNSKNTISYSLNLTEAKISDDELVYSLEVSTDKDTNYESLVNEKRITGNYTLKYNLGIETNNTLYLKITFKSYNEEEATTLKGKLEVSKNLTKKDVFVNNVTDSYNTLVNKIEDLNGIRWSGYYIIGVNELGLSDLTINGFIVVDATDISNLKYYFTVYNDSYMLKEYKYTSGFTKKQVKNIDYGYLGDTSQDSVCALSTKKGCSRVLDLTYNEGGSKKEFKQAADEVIETVKKDFNKNKKEIVIYNVQTDIKNNTNVRGYILINNTGNEPEYYLYLTNDIFMISGYNLTKLGDFTTTSSSIRAYVESSFNLSAVSAGTVCSFTGFSDCKDINGNIIY